MSTFVTTRMSWIFVLFASSLLCFVDAQFSMGCSYFDSPRLMVADTVVKRIRIPIVGGKNYLPNQHCEWKIEAVKPNFIIKLFIEKIEIDGADLDDECTRDYLDFFEVKKSGNLIHMSRVCGTRSKGRLLETSSSQMMVHFISNMKFEFSGFQLSFMAQPRESEESDDTTTGLVVGIIVGLVSIIAAVLIIVYFFRRMFRMKNSTPQPILSSSFSTSPYQRNRTPSQELREQAQHPQLITSDTNAGRIPSTQQDDSSYEILSRPPPAYGSDSFISSSSFNPRTPHNAPGSQIQERRSSRLSGAFSTATPSGPVSGNGDDGVDGGDYDSNNRSRTPPPSYEMAVMYGNTSGPQGDVVTLPSKPPDYDFVIEDELRQFDVDSAV